jgi:chromosome segregation ATPase
LEKKAKLTEETEILQKILDELNAKKHKAEIELEEVQNVLKEKHTEVENMTIKLAQKAEEKLKLFGELEEFKTNLKGKESELYNINNMIAEKQIVAKQKQNANEELSKQDMELKQNISVLEKKMQTYEDERNLLAKHIETEKNQVFVLGSIKNGKLTH